MFRRPPHDRLGAKSNAQASYTQQRQVVGAIADGKHVVDTQPLRQMGGGLHNNTC